MPKISYAITEYASQAHGRALSADFRSSESRAAAIWSLTNGLAANPLSRRARENLEARAAALAAALETALPKGVFDGRGDRSPVVLWMRDGGEDVSDAPTKVAVAFPDDFALYGPDDGPSGVFYASVVVSIDPTWFDGKPYADVVSARGFAELYRETTLEEVDAVPGLLSRVVEAVRERRPDLSFAPDAPPIQPGSR